MFYGGYANDVSLVMEADAVVANAQAKLRRFDVLEALDVAFTSVKIAGQRMQDAEGSGLVDGTELSLGMVVPDNAPVHA